MKYIQILLFAFLLFSFSATAQKTMDSGYIKLEIVDVKSDDEQMGAMMKQMMEGTQHEFWFSKEHSLVKLNMMGGMMNMTTLTENKTKNNTMLMDAMGQKMHVQSTAEERGDQNADMAKNVKVEYDKSDTKEILGYECVKANITFPSEVPVSFVAYVAKDIQLDNSIIQGMESFKLDGFPLEYLISTQGLDMRVTAKEIEKKVEKSVFKLDTEGYEKMSYEEFTQSLGKMAGGMGF